MTPESSSGAVPTQAFDTNQIDPAKAYRLLTHAVAPRPIAFVSSKSVTGVYNLAPFSFFMAGGASPPSVVFSPVAGRSGVAKDTLTNIVETREFVINVVTYGMRDGMNQTCYPYPAHESEWPHSGFTALPSRCVSPPRVAESPIALECRLFQVVPHGSGPLASNYVIGEVLCFHVADALLDAAGEVDALKVDYITRMGGDWYARATPDAMFELPRPAKP